MVSMNEHNDIKKMARILDTKPNADVFIRELASLQRTDNVSDLKRKQIRLQKNFGVRFTMKEVEDFYEEFQRLGWGKLKRERGMGAHSRFTWTPGFAYVQVAKVLLKDAPQTVVGRTSVMAPKVDRDTPRGVPTKSAAIVLTLRSGQEIRLSPDDARDLQHQLSSLF